MNGQRLMMGASLLVTGLGLWACTIAPVAPVGPRDPNVVDAHVAKQMCDVAPLAEERTTDLQILNEVARSAGVNFSVDVNAGPIGAGAGVGVGAGTSASGDIDTEHRQTILQEKLYKYRAEIDASYRFVTMNCTAYDFCLEHGVERCEPQRESLLKSQEEFNKLALDLEKIDRGGHEHHGDRYEYQSYGGMLGH